MTWPTTQIVTTNLDAGTKSPANARAQLLEAVVAVNSIPGSGGAASVGFVQSGAGAATGRTTQDKLREDLSVKDFGAVGDGVTNEATAFSTATASLSVPLGTYRIATSATVSADLDFAGGQVTVDSGVTLTLNGSVTAPSKIVFKGAGTVIINRGEIDVAWFDGTDASSKWDFCKRGIQNTNGLGKIVVFSKPATTDAWSTTFQIAGANVWGPRWRVDAPIIILDQQAGTVFRTPSGFVATTAMGWMWQIGTAAGANKVDYCHFPDKLSIEGNNGTCTYAGIMYGSSHMRIPYQEIYRCAGWLLQPTLNKQVSDVKFDFMDSGFLWGPILTFDGSAGSNNTITDFVVDFINSNGFASGHAPNALVQMNSNYQSIKIGKVVHRAVVAGAVDATGSVVSLTNLGATAPGGVYYPPRYDICIGPVLNGSSTITARAIAFSDQSGGAATKFAGVTIEAGSLVDGGALSSDISIDYANGTIVQGLTAGRVLSVSGTCANTTIYGIDRAQVADSGVSTLINGKSKAPAFAVGVTASPMVYTNNNKFDVDLQVQGGTVTQVNYGRGGATGQIYLGASLGAGIFPASPGDTITIIYSAAPAQINGIPR